MPRASRPVVVRRAFCERAARSLAPASSENGQATATSTLADLPAVSTAVSLSCSTLSVVQLGQLLRGHAECYSHLLGIWHQSSPANVLGVGQVISATWARISVHQCFLPRYSTGQHALVSGGQHLGATRRWHLHVRYCPHNPQTHPQCFTSGQRGCGCGSWRQPCGWHGHMSAPHRWKCELCRTEHWRQRSGTTLGDGQQYPQAPRAYFVPVVGILPVASEDGQCYDGVDNDGDGKTDLDDSDCAQDLGSAIGNAVAQVSFTGVFGNYLQESCNVHSLAPATSAAPKPSSPGPRPAAAPTSSTPTEVPSTRS